MYGKLFSSLYQGTLRGCSDEILVFTNLIAHADMHGIVDKHWRSIAEETGLDIDRVKAAVATLEAPDPESRSPEMEGRRIIPLDEHRAWGWQIVNHGKYRAIKNEDDRREQNRLAQQKWREKQNNMGKPSVSRRKHDKPSSAHTDTDTDTDTEENKIKTKKTHRKKKELAPYPENFEITEGMQKWFSENCPRLDLHKELEKFKNRCIAKGTEYKDWAAGWRTQMLNAEEWFRPDTNGNGTSKPSGYDPTKDIMSPDFVQESPKPNFGDDAEFYFSSHHNDGTREKYEQMKINWLERPSCKGLESQIEEYERGTRFRQRFSEAG